MKNEIETLIKKAAEAVDPTDSMKYSQSALNAANAYIVLKNSEK